MRFQNFPFCSPILNVIFNFGCALEKRKKLVANDSRPGLKVKLQTWNSYLVLSRPKTYPVGIWSLLYFKLSYAVLVDLKFVPQSFSPFFFFWQTNMFRNPFYRKQNIGGTTLPKKCFLTNSDLCFILNNLYIKAKKCKCRIFLLLT